MKRTILATLCMCMALTLTGCGDDWNDGYYYYPYPPYPPSPIFTEIFSNPTLDGDISKNPVTGDFTVTQGMSQTVQSVFAGTNQSTGEEFRAFLDFPLTGAGGVPGGAFINSAALNIYINNIQTPTGTIPVRIDLVSYPQPLIGTDFDSASLATVSTTLYQSDFGQNVAIDVTPLMVMAQSLALLDFQIRILAETPTGIIEINDTTGADWQLFAPLLDVTYSSGGRP